MLLMYGYLEGISLINSNGFYWRKIRKYEYYRTACSFRGTIGWGVFFALSLFSSLSPFCKDRGHTLWPFTAETWILSLLYLPAIRRLHRPFRVKYESAPGSSRMLHASITRFNLFPNSFNGEYFDTQVQLLLISFMGT